MRDELEKFIALNREAFDSESPSPGVWNAIQQDLDQPARVRRINWMRPMSVAASALIILGLGMVIGLSMQGGLTSESPSEAYAEVTEAEQYYQREVGEKMALLASYDERDQEVSEDIAQLDTLINELKLELANIPRGKEEDVINAIIQNYQTKIAILERVLETYEGNNTKDELENNYQDE